MYLRVGDVEVRSAQQGQVAGIFTVQHGHFHQAVKHSLKLTSENEAYRLSWSPIFSESVLQENEHVNRRENVPRTGLKKVQQCLHVWKVHQNAFLSHAGTINLVPWVSNSSLKGHDSELSEEKEKKNWWLKEWSLVCGYWLAIHVLPLKFLTCQQHSTYPPNTCTYTYKHMCT